MRHRLYAWINATSQARLNIIAVLVANGTISVGADLNAIVTNRSAYKIAKSNSLQVVGPPVRIIATPVVEKL